MTPAVPLRCPNDLFPVVYVVTIQGAGFPQIPRQRPIRKECLWFLRNQRSGLSGSRIYLDNSIHLVPALIVFKRKAAPVLPPSRLREAVRVREQAVIHNDLFPRLGLKEHRAGYIDGITGLGIFSRRVLWLYLISGR